MKRKRTYEEAKTRGRPPESEGHARNTGRDCDVRYDDPWK